MVFGPIARFHALVTPVTLLVPLDVARGVVDGSFAARIVRRHTLFGGTVFHGHRDDKSDNRRDIEKV
jgi:hypothetical protein